jgi:uncharacterized protein YbjT (DUF2867 family)
VVGDEEGAVDVISWWGFAFLPGPTSRLEVAHGDRGAPSLHRTRAGGHSAVAVSVARGMVVVMTVRDVVVLGATGTVGRRVARIVGESGLTVRGASRSASPTFEWEDPATWPAWARGADAVFVMAPDGVPVDPGFLQMAVEGGTRRLVLLSSKAIDVMDDRRLLAAEQAVRDTGAEWTIVRADWFDQNFDEGVLRDAVLAGEVTIPVGDTRMAFNDAEDVAAVAAVALTEDGHEGEAYEISGPEAHSFAEITSVLSEASGREVRFSGDVERYVEVMTGFGLPEEQVRAEARAFQALAAAGDAEVSDTVERLTGRPPVPFRQYAEIAAARGAWA